MDYLWVSVAFACGFLVRQINLPPLIGYLAAGFGLHALGFEPDTALAELSDLGISLLLFTIGLKLNIRNLIKPEVWAGAMGHMVIIVVLTTINCLLLGYFGLTYFADLDWTSAALVGFAVSFSSTVCAVKILEERGEMSSRHGQVAIGILIVQDIAAVVFMSLAAGVSPSWWALGLFFLPLARPLIIRVLQRCGHGELLPLAGFFLAVAGGELFELVGLKADFGVLVIAVLLSGQAKANELAKSMLAFKDLFLIGFFLSIGFTALPTTDMLVIALIMAVSLPVKAGLFFVWLTRLKLRTRSAFLATLSLANYSEFGLIVCSVSVAYGMLAEEWLVIMALAVAFSVIISSAVNVSAHKIYGRWREYLGHFERTVRLQEDEFSQPGEAVVLVIGMGRVGTGAYDMFRQNLEKKVCGIEVDRDKVSAHCQKGRHVIAADAEDPEFWEHINLRNIELVMLSMPNYLDILEVVKQLQSANYTGKTAGIARYEDERHKLLASGIDVVFDFYMEAGAGFADQSLQMLDQ
jgi:glutathione-regulated potassium-efflux system ancillary protein KefC